MNEERRRIYQEILAHPGSHRIGDVMNAEDIMEQDRRLAEIETRLEAIDLGLRGQSGRLDDLEKRLAVLEAKPAPPPADAPERKKEEPLKCPRGHDAFGVYSGKGNTYRGLCVECGWAGPPRATPMEALAAWNTRAPAIPEGMRLVQYDISSSGVVIRTANGKIMFLGEWASAIGAMGK